MKQLPATNAERVGLARRILKIRYDLSPEMQAVAWLNNIRHEEIDDSTLMMGSIDMVVVAIIEQYTLHLERGLRSEEAVRFLNQLHAALLLPAGEHLPEMEPPHSLDRYIAHYIVHIHLKGEGLDLGFVSPAIQEVLKFYGRLD